MNEEMKCAYCGKDLTKEDDGKCCRPTKEEIEKRHAWEDEMIKLYGFYIHYVPNPPEQYVDCHTHGLQKSFNHSEIQFIIPLPSDTAKAIMHTVVDIIRKGHNLVDGEKLDNVICDYQVLAKKMKDQAGEEYFRIIFPDIEGHFPNDEGCEEFYQKQSKEDLIW